MSDEPRNLHETSPRPCPAAPCVLPIGHGGEHTASEAHLHESTGHGREPTAHEWAALLRGVARDLEAQNVALDDAYVEREAADFIEQQAAKIDRLNELLVLAQRLSRLSIFGPGINQHHTIFELWRDFQATVRTLS